MLRAMVPLQCPPAADLTGTPVLLLSGEADPIVPAANAARLASMLTGVGSNIRYESLPSAHGLTQADFEMVKTWVDAASRRN